MLNEALRLIRVFHDLKLGELADSIDLSASYLSEIESGKKVPSMEVVEKYAAYFRLPKSSILFFSEGIETAPLKKNLIVSSMRKNMIRFLSIVEKGKHV